MTMRTDKLPAYLWIMTAAVFLLLILTTIGLLIESKSEDNSGVVGYVLSANPIVYLYATPNTSSQILTVLNPDTEILVRDTAIEDEQPWLYIETDTHDGWLPANFIDLKSP